MSIKILNIYNFTIVYMFTDINIYTHIYIYTQTHIYVYTLNILAHTYMLSALCKPTISDLELQRGKGIKRLPEEILSFDRSVLKSYKDLAIYSNLRAL